MMTITKEAYAEAKEAILASGATKPEIGLILGSGLGELAKEVVNQKVIPYAEIPHFPMSTVEGHAGQLVLGELAGRSVVMMQGRFHLYEGHSLDHVTFPIRVMKELGIHTLIVTNAAGGVNLLFKTGVLMLISDHINFTGQNPLIGMNHPELGDRFPDMSEAYDPELRAIARKVAKEQELDIQEGIYVGLTGPSYETPAEIRMFRQWGADAVGMSTVPEVIVARHASLSVLGISCITNMASGILPQPLSHQEVMETGERVKDEFIRLIKGVLQQIKGNE